MASSLIEFVVGRAFREVHKEENTVQPGSILIKFPVEIIRKSIYISLDEALL